MEHCFQTLLWFKQNWYEFPKDNPFQHNVGSRKGYAIAFNVDTLRVFLAALMGPRGGVSGVLVIVDPSQKIEVDQLLCGNYDIPLIGGILSNLYTEVQFERKDFHKVCPRHLNEIMQKWKRSPELVRTKADVVGFGELSVVTLSGGAVSPR